MLKKAIGLLINLFIYCGLPKEEYSLVRKEAYSENFRVWKRLNLLIALFFAIIAAITPVIRESNDTLHIMLVLVGYSALSAFLFIFVLKQDSLIGQLMIYGSMILLIWYSIEASLLYPDMMAVTFIVMLVLLPMFMIDRPYCMAGFLLICIGVYLLCVRPGAKSPEAFRMDAVNCVSYGMLGIVINLFYVRLRMRQFMLLYHERKHVEEQKLAAQQTALLNETLKKTCESLIEVMGDVVESRDTDSGEHINRVKGYTNILANKVMEEMPEYQLDAYTVDLITSASALHDVGKITVPDAILNKPGKLTSEEFDIMKKHCDSGCRILEKMRGKWSKDYLEMGMTVCRSHHEKWDGRGYPDGLKGDEIPIAAQIVSIADIFDALTTKRSYKEAFSPEKAFSMIMNGECGAFSAKLLHCLTACRDQFIRHYADPAAFRAGDRPFELVSRSNPGESFVLGFYDQDRTLRESARLHEELIVLEHLSEELLYVCYVDIPTNEVIRFRADKRISDILDSYGTQLHSNERFDRLLNSIIVKEDYDDFRGATERYSSIDRLQKGGHILSDFRVRLQDGVHYCRMRLSQDKENPNAVIIGIALRDEEHAREQEYARLEQELTVARQEMENREKLADRLAVIDCISSEYDYVCTLNARTMEVTVYRAEEWIRDMFKNLEDIVVSPEVRSATLKGIIYPDDFNRFNEQSRHEAVMAALKAGGSYSVDYRAYKYGKLVNYQTRYAIDKNDPTRIVIGLHCTD